MTSHRITKTVDFEVYPEDAPNLMTWIEADKWARSLGGGWRLPTLEELKMMYEQKDAIGGFKTAAANGSDCPDWYWSSTEDRDYPSGVHGVRFSGGNEGWDLRDYGRLSVRPVRLVAASAPTPAPPGEED